MLIDKDSVRPGGRASNIYRTCNDICGVVFACAGLFLLAGNALAAQVKVLTLDAAIAEGVKNNPALAAKHEKATALAEVPTQVGTLPDPRLILNTINLPVDTFAVSQEAMTQLQVGISQALPFPGKLSLREEVAALDAQVASQDIEEARLQLIKNVKSVWWGLFYLDHAIEIVIRNQELLRQFVTVAQTKYKVGKGLQQDVLLAQVELSKMLDHEIRLRAVRLNLEAQLNAMLDRPTDQPVQLPAEVNEDLLDAGTADELYRQADERRPLLGIRQKEIEAAKYRLDLARKDYMPDFSLGAVYGFRSGQNPNGRARADFASLMLSMNLPLRAGRRQDRAVNQRSSEVLSQRYRLADTRSLVRAAISRALADYRQARRQVELFHEGIIPQATQTVASMRAGYQVNKVDFLNLVRSQITLFNYETRYWKALSEANQALARLAAAVGKERIDE